METVFFFYIYVRKGVYIASVSHALDCSQRIKFTLAVRC